VDAFIFMHALEGKSLPKELRNLLLPSTLLEVVRDSYARGWREESGELYIQTISWGLSADEMEMDDRTKEAILSLAFRSMMRLRRDSDARDLLRKFDHRNYKSRFSLHGFYHRIRQEFEEAIPHYWKAWELRIHDEALLHELCICLFRTGQLDEIRQLLLTEGARAERNAYLLDLKIQIATVEGDFSEAERLIGLLRAQPDDGGRSVKREAIIALRRDQNPAKAVAILDSGISAGLGGMLDLRAVRCMALSRMTGAESRAREDAQYVASRPAGIQIAHRLEAHLSLAKQNWPAALASLH